jgi:hypothetical protein
LANFQVSATDYFEFASDMAQTWWAEIQGEEGATARLYAVARLAGLLGGIVLGFFLFRWFISWASRLPIWRRLKQKMSGTHTPSAVGFYERMLELLAAKGILRESDQTPREFAASLNKPEAMMITDKYNRVRFGGRDLTPDESAEIDQWLHRLAKTG